MMLGESGGLVCSAPGTLGLLVRRAAPPGVLVLGCSHVLARSGHFGMEFRDVPLTQRVVQQPISAGCDPAAGRIGILQDGFSVLRPGSAGDTTSDIALALLDPAIAANATGRQSATGERITEVAREDPSEWREGMRTVLLGAIHRGARGSVIAYRGDRPEFIEFPGVGEARFTGLTRYQTACAPGDSGGAVTDDRGRLLGIHIGGDAAQGIGVFLPIASFLAKNQLRLL
jgi:hypothetical protein